MLTLLSIICNWPQVISLLVQKCYRILYTDYSMLIAWSHFYEHSKLQICTVLCSKRKNTVGIKFSTYIFFTYITACFYAVKEKFKGAPKYICFDGTKPPARHTKFRKEILGIRLFFGKVRRAYIVAAGLRSSLNPNFTLQQVSKPLWICFIVCKMGIASLTPHWFVKRIKMCVPALAKHIITGVLLLPFCCKLHPLKNADRKKEGKLASPWVSQGCLAVPKSTAFATSNNSQGFERIPFQCHQCCQYKWVKGDWKCQQSPVVTTTTPALNFSTGILKAVTSLKYSQADCWQRPGISWRRSRKTLWDQKKDKGGIGRARSFQIPGGKRRRKTSVRVKVTASKLPRLIKGHSKPKRKGEKGNSETRSCPCPDMDPIL